MVRAVNRSQPFWVWSKYLRLFCNIVYFVDCIPDSMDIFNIAKLHLTVGVVVRVFKPTWIKFIAECVQVTSSVKNHNLIVYRVWETDTCKDFFIFERPVRQETWSYLRRSPDRTLSLRIKKRHRRKSFFSSKTTRAFNFWVSDICWHDMEKGVGMTCLEISVFKNSELALFAFKVDSLATKFFLWTVNIPA